MDLQPLKEYALFVDPCIKEFEIENTKGIRIICSDLPSPNKKVIDILNRSEINQDYKKYVILIYLKLYTKQLVHYHQSFDVRESPYFLKRFGDDAVFTRAFCETIGQNYFERKLGPEFLPAYKSIEFIDKNSIFKNDSLILRQLEIIDSIQTIK